MSDAPTNLPSLLALHRDALIRFLTKEASGLLRYESEEDLAQGVHLRALGVEEHFAYEGEGQFFSWLWKVARQHVADRYDYWTALKRSAGRLLRVTGGAEESSMAGSGVEPPASMTGPATFADRRDLLRVAMRALDTLRPRDRRVIELSALGADLKELGLKLDLAYDAAQQARSRAFERFRQAFEVFEQRG